MEQKEAEFVEEGEQTFVHGELKQGVWTMHGVPKPQSTLWRDGLAIAGFLVFLAWMIHLRCNGSSCKFMGL